MEITSVASFLDHHQRIRERTLKAIRCIPPDKIDWTYKDGKFTFGDIIRHIAAIERYMYAENVRDRPSCYAGCGKELAAGYDETLTYFNTLHQESLAIFRTLTPENLREKCITPAGIAISKWKWLRAMTEHEIHHRAHIYLYLSLLGLPVEPIFGLTSEEVAERSKRGQDKHIHPH